MQSQRAKDFLVQFKKQVKEWEEKFKDLPAKPKPTKGSSDKPSSEPPEVSKPT